MPRSFIYGVLPFIFLFSFSVYLITLNPTFQPDDSAETMAACVSLTPQHPSGYPLYTFLGSLAVSLPLGSEPFRVNLLAAFLGALGVGFTALYLFRAATLLDRKDNQVWVSMLSALGGSLLLAFSKTYWAQSITAKGGVYILQSFVFLAAFYLIEKIHEAPEGRKTLWAFSLLVGLGGLAATNGWEMLLLFGMAGLGYFVFQRFLNQKESKFGIKVWLWLGSLILIGLSPYLLLPLRPGLREIMVWGDTQSWRGFIHFLSNSDLRKEVALKLWRNILGFSTGPKDLDEVWKQLPLLGPQLNRIFGHLFNDIGLLAWIPLIASFSHLVRGKRFVFLTFGLITLFLLIAANGFIFHTENENLWCIDKFLLSANLFQAICAGVGIGVLVLKAARSLTRRLTRSKRKKVIEWPAWFLAAGIGATLLFPAYSFFQNFQSNDQSCQTWAYDYAADLMKSLKKDALFIPEGDNSIFSVLYFQEALHRRMDVTLVPAFYLWTSWGGRELEGKLRKSGLGLSKDEVPTLGARVFHLMDKMIERNEGQRPIQFSANLDLLDRCYFSLQPAVTQSGSLFSLLRPDGLSLDWGKLFDGKGLDLIGQLRDRHPSEKREAAQGAMDTLFAGQAQAFFNAAEYCARNNLEERADRYYQAALGQTGNPKFLARVWQGRGDFWLAHGKKPEALEAYQKSIRLYPDQTSYAKILRVFLGDTRFAEALDTAFKSVELFPDSAKAWKDLAACEAAMGRNQAAQEALEHAGRLNSPQETSIR